MNPAFIIILLLILVMIWFFMTITFNDIGKIFVNVFEEGKENQKDE